MSRPKPDRGALEDLWRQRLKDAELRLTSNRQHLKEVERDFPLGEIRNSDGHYAYRRALHAETVALGEYRRALKIVNEIIVHGKIPDVG